jgi:hypothetical protein
MTDAPEKTGKRQSLAQNPPIVVEDAVMPPPPPVMELSLVLIRDPPA